METKPLVSQLLANSEKVSHYTLSGYHCAKVSGPDAQRYLHGRLTQNVKELSEGNSTESLLLNPQGKILSKLRLKLQNDSFYILADPGNGWEEFRQDLLQFKVADQLELEQQQDAVALVLIATKQEILEKTILEVAKNCVTFNIQSFGDELFASYVFFPGVEEKTNSLSSTNLIEQSPLSEITFQQIRICSAQAIAGVDLSNKNIATEIEISNLVSFNKGCYAGQEVVEMSTARGRANRLLSSFLIDSTNTIASGTVIESAEGKNAGYITSSIKLNETQSLAIGFVKTTYSDNDKLKVENANCVRIS